MKTSRKIILSLFALLALAFIAGMFNVDPLLGFGGLSLAFPAIIAGIKDSQTLSEEKRSIWAKAEAIVAKVKEEKRDRTDEETTEYDGYLARMKELDKEIQRAKDHEARVAEMAGQFNADENKKKESREANKGYNLLKALRSQLPNQKLEGLELEMHQEAVKEARELGSSINGIGIPAIIVEGEHRDLTATLGTAGDQGGILVPTMISGFIEPLKAKMVLRELGAQFLTGLSGKFDMPVGTAAAATWEGENDTNAETSPTFSKKSWGPNRLGAFSDISKQLLFQTSFGVQNYVQNEIISAIAMAVEAAAINGAGTGNVPEGILNTTGIGSVAGGINGAAPTLANIIALETAIATANADIGSLGYLTNPGVRGKLKQTAKDTGSGLFVYGDGQNPLNGYKTLITTQVPNDLTKGTSVGVCSAILFGNFQDLLIGQWGGLDIVVNPYTKAKEGLVELVINSWWDILVRRAESFAAMKDALTA